MSQEFICDWRESSRAELWAVGAIHRVPGCTLDSTPRSWLPTGTDCTHRTVLHAGGVEGRAPASPVVLRQLQIEALAVHPDGYVADACPGVQPGAERPECAVIRGHGKSGEPHCCAQEVGALVEHKATRAPRPPALSRQAEW